MAQSHQIKKVSWWHQAIVDWELQNPDKTMNECAECFGVTPSYLSIVRNSDAYQQYAAERRAQHNENVSKGLIEKVEELATVGVEVLQERIEKERAEIGLGIVKDTTDMALRALGFGPRNGGKPNDGAPLVGVYLGVGSDVLQEAREQMRTVNGPKLLEGVSHEVPPAE